MVTFFLSIALVAIFLGGVLVMHLMPRKRKTYSQKSSFEKFSSTLKTRLSKCLQELADNARTPEVIEYEITQELDRFYSSKCAEAKSILETYRQAAQATEQSKRLLTNNIAMLNKRLKEAKERYENADEAGKSKIVSIVECAMAAKKNATKCLEETVQQIETLSAKKLEVEDQIEMFVTMFNIKKVEIFTHIATVKSASVCNSNFTADFNISALIDDLDMAISAKADNAKVDKAFAAGQTEDIAASASADVTDEVKIQAQEFLNN